jgi:hypothetical protein
MYHVEAGAVQAVARELGVSFCAGVCWQQPKEVSYSYQQRALMGM